jgi:hypothetical protein
MVLYQHLMVSIVDNFKDVNGFTRNINTISNYTRHTDTLIIGSNMTSNASILTFLCILQQYMN